MSRRPAAAPGLNTATTSLQTRSLHRSHVPYPVGTQSEELRGCNTGHLPEVVFRMRAMLLDAPRRPLRLSASATPPPEPGPGQVLVAVKTCGVCRTDLHVLDGELPHPKLPP